MCQALLEIMEPVIQQREQEKMERGLQQGLLQGLQQGIQVTIEALREFGHGDSEIKTMVMRKYDISAEEAEGYL